MSISRRKFLQVGLMAGAGLMLPIRWVGSGKAWAFSQSPLGIRKFIQPLPGLGPTGIPLLSPITKKDPVTGLLTDYYSIQMGQFTQWLHPDLPMTGTKLWGYADAASPNPRYLGGVIVAQRGRPVRLKVTNQLPNSHPLPVDTTIMGADMGAQVNRAVVHLHGGLTPWNSDGVPFSWFTPAGGPVGETFLNGVAPGKAEYYYTNDQSARLVWYHDHALGITRLNAYAGLASAYIIRDDIEMALIKSNVIPSPTYEIPLIIQDKTFFDGSDNNYPVTSAQRGDLWYPYQYDLDRWSYGPNVSPPPSPNLPVPSAVPEFFSDTAFVNGTCYPYVNVQQRHYRFRILNASQARFYNLQLYYADATGMEATTVAGPRMIQIGTEGGFLPFPVALNNPPLPITFDPITLNANQYNLLMAPAERADVIIDFSKVPVGSTLILYNDAPAPFPGGDPLNDYYTPAGASPYIGPNTHTLLQFRVVPRVGNPDPPMMSILEQVAVNRGSIFSSLYSNLLPQITDLSTRHAARVRNLTLNEDFDEYGRLIQRLGTTTSKSINNQGLPTWAIPYMDPATETPHAGDIEIWNIFNLTGDTHPIHLHLVNFRILSRQPFVSDSNGNFTLTGTPRGPDPNERGWKETARMNPGECTTIIMKFDLPKVPFKIPLSPRTGGHEYVWHCHILEHEEHDMMRPLVVTPSAQHS